MDRNSEARWYFAESTDRSAFYDLFFQADAIPDTEEQLLLDSFTLTA